MSVNLAAKRIRDAMKPNGASMANDLGTNIVAGRVTSINPLLIQVENRPPLDEDYLTVSILCKSFKGIWRGLEVGDIVNMIQMSGNQKYYVMERQGMELG